MDHSHNLPASLQAGAVQQEFPPPPASSGAAQGHPMPIAEAYAPPQDSYQQHSDQAPPQPPRPMQPNSTYYPPPPPLPTSHEGQFENVSHASEIPGEDHTMMMPQSEHMTQNHGQFESVPHATEVPRQDHTMMEPYGEQIYQGYEQPPPQPPRPAHNTMPGAIPEQGYNPATYMPAGQSGSYVPPPPPRRQNQILGDDDPSNPVHYTRDPHKLIAYLVPFPRPRIGGGIHSSGAAPERFLIFTPPPPPLSKPEEGEKEAKLHKVQRKWQEEVRSAKTSQAKTASWKGVKSKATKGISKAMSYTTGSNLDFLGRVSGHKSDSEDDHEGDTTHKTVGVEEMVLVYPQSMGIGQEDIREEFVNTMLRTKTKAQRDAIIATGLMPVAYGIDILATLVWPFGGLGEIDTVWAYANIRGAKTARSVTKRLSSGSETGDHEKDSLRLNFIASQRIEVLRKYLAADCHKVDSKLFPDYVSAPTESDVLEAIGWSPAQTGGESKNWEDEQWEMQEVKEDVKMTFHKGSKEWNKWCKIYEKDPEKAMKK